MAVTGTLALVTGAWLWAAYRTSDDRLPPGDYEPRPEPHWNLPAENAKAIRDHALAAAQVWREPEDPIEKVDFTRNPGDDEPLPTDDPLPCRFLPRAIGGTTPKFDCVLRGGEVVKVKYGSAELHAEIAASRLLAALGFGSDRMYFLPRVRCFGCPYSPFRTYQVLELARVDGAYTRRIDYDQYRDFKWVAVERRFKAASIDTPEGRGWGFFELARVDPGRGGAPRRHLDALRLMAVVLHHWDNKAENQRLVCLSAPTGDENGECAQPFALLQDLGATFGPNKVNYPSWSTRPVWSEPATCRVSMEDMPYGGATFQATTISEEGRRFLAERITRLTEAQLKTLFEAARFPEYHGRGDEGADPMQWVRAFRRKAAEIADRAPCPPS
jgi:hypothetical protein